MSALSQINYTMYTYIKENSEFPFSIPYLQATQE